MRTRGADVGGGCLEEVTPSFKNEKDSGQRKWGRGCLEPKPAGRQDNGGGGQHALPTGSGSHIHAALGHTG